MSVTYETAKNKRSHAYDEGKTRNEGPMVKQLFRGMEDDDAMDDDAEDGESAERDGNVIFS